MTTEAEALTWNPIAGQTTTAGASTTGPHRPHAVWAIIPAHKRALVRGENWFEHLAEVKPEGWTPPFWVDENKIDLNRRSGKYPGSPPMEAGQKALVVDDWGSPGKVVEVVGMHDNHLVGKYGAATVYGTAWLALTDDAVLDDGITGAAGPKNALTEEEAAALDAEFNEWARFLGARAEKYGWCGTFENILTEVGVKPWRPGFKSVTLTVRTELEASDEVKAALVKAMGGEVTLATSRVDTNVVLTDVSRDDYNSSNWDSLLRKAGYKNFSNIRVTAKEMETAE